MRNIVKSFCVLFTCAIFLFSCSSNEHGDVDNSLPQFNQQNNVLINQPPTDSVIPQISQPQTQNNVALNPPHGAPGHDCNIQVGAPLDGSENNYTAPPPVDVPVNQTAKLNPPHGEPGHLCEIPVGQALP